MYGSLQNRILERTVKQEPIEIGDGATHCGYSDRSAYTVVAIEYFKTGQRKGQEKAVWVTRDTATVKPGTTYLDQEYDLESNMDGERLLVKRRKNGWSTEGGSAFTIGYRSEYRDPHF